MVLIGSAIYGWLSFVLAAVQLARAKYWDVLVVATFLKQLLLLLKAVYSLILVSVPEFDTFLNLR